MEPSNNNPPPTSIEYALQEVSAQPYIVSQLPVEDVKDSELKMPWRYNAILLTLLIVVQIWLASSMWRCRKDMSRFMFYTRIGLLVTLLVVSQLLT